MHHVVLLTEKCPASAFVELSQCLTASWLQLFKPNWWASAAAHRRASEINIHLISMLFCSHTAYTKIKHVLHLEKSAEHMSLSCLQHKNKTSLTSIFTAAWIKTNPERQFKHDHNTSQAEKWLNTGMKCRNTERREPSGHRDDESIIKKLKKNEFKGKHRNRMYLSDSEKFSRRTGSPQSFKIKSIPHYKNISSLYSTGSEEVDSDHTTPCEHLGWSSICTQTHSC